MVVENLKIIDGLDEKSVISWKNCLLEEKDRRGSSLNLTSKNHIERQVAILDKYLELLKSKEV